MRGNNIYGKEVTETEVSITLVATPTTSWDGVYYDITNTDTSPVTITTDKDYVLTYPPTLTDAQFTAYQAAGIRPWGAVTDGQIRLKATGTVPTIDLPMVLIVREKNL